MQNATYASLFQSQVMAEILQPRRAFQNFPLGVPYDFLCSILKDELPNRTCGARGLYFGTIKSKNQHIRWCKNPKRGASVTKSHDEQAPTSIMTRPVRVAARRQSELILEYQRGGGGGGFYPRIKFSYEIRNYSSVFFVYRCLQTFARSTLLKLLRCYCLRTQGFIFSQFLNNTIVLVTIKM